MSKRMNKPIINGFVKVLLVLWIVSMAAVVIFAVKNP